jgi:putative ABC transport system permease protein
MGTLFKIVYRNLKEHKVKTLIIGLIITFGIFILIAGNSIVDTVSAGIKKNFIETFTAHIVVVPSSRPSPSIVPDPETIQSGPPPAIEEFPVVLDYVQGLADVVAASPQITSLATLQYQEAGSGFSQLLAVDPEMYRDTFPNNVNLLEGAFLEPGQEGIVISEFALDMLEESSGMEISVGDSILLTRISEISGMKIREVPIVGIHRVATGAQMMVSYLDAENARILSGLTQITDVEAVLTADEQAGLGAVDEDELFGGEESFLSVVGPGGDSHTSGDAAVSGSAAVPEHGLNNAVEPDAWHYLLVRLKDESLINRGVKEMNQAFNEMGLAVRAYPWIDGAGQIATMTTALRTVINVIVLIIAVVAVIIIMNTLVISITERIGEIGTMRAIGAQKPFVRRMIVMETLLIALFFGGLGVVLGAAGVGVVRAVQIETSNMILQVLAGGSIIKPVISTGSIFISLSAMIVAGVLASLYPASIALRIEPRQAMAS